MAKPLKIVNPATGQVIQEVATHDAAAIVDLVARARAAQGDWVATPIETRMDCVRTFRDLLQQRVDTLALTLTAETGKPITQARNEILATAERINFFVDHVTQVLRPKQVFLARDESTQRVNLEEVITQDSLGVIANISAWNYPYFVGINVFVPALLTGNTVLYKPSEIATMTGLQIAALLYEAGIPEPSFVPIIGPGQTGATLLQEKLDGVFFTGSFATGQKIARAVAPQLLKLQLELGGKDPVYVCDDVDIAIAALSLAGGAFYNNGQSCCAVERIYVHTNIYDEFLQAFLSQVNAFKLGDPTAPETDLGPLSCRSQLAVLSQQVEDALAKGAMLLTGGYPVDRPGWYFAPTVLSEVTHEMTVMGAESFGPIIGIQRVEDDGAAIALMNDTEYGLTAAVYSRDRERAKTILSQVRSGTAYWNCCDRVSPRLPWSGRGHSGIGSTLSLTGIEAFLQPRSWHWRRP